MQLLIVDSISSLITPILGGSGPHGSYSLHHHYSRKKDYVLHLWLMQSVHFSFLSFSLVDKGLDDVSITFNQAVVIM